MINLKNRMQKGLFLVFVLLFSFKSFSQQIQVLQSYYAKTTFKILDEKGNVAAEKKFADLTEKEIKRLQDIFYEEIESLEKREVYSKKQIDQKIKSGGPQIVEIDPYILKRNTKSVNGVYDYSNVNVKPKPSEGMELFLGFVRYSFKVPETPAGVLLKGQVYIGFVVREDGSLTDFRVLRDLGYGAGEEALRVLKLSKNWIPGEIDGEKVATTFVLPISIPNIE